MSETKRNKSVEKVEISESAAETDKKPEITSETKPEETEKEPHYLVDSAEVCDFDGDDDDSWQYYDAEGNAIEKSSHSTGLIIALIVACTIIAACIIFIVIKSYNGQWSSQEKETTTVTVETTTAEEENASGYAKVPSVTGMLEATAKKQLEDKGFTVNVTYETATGTQLGNVISQSIPAGSSLPTGYEITISVGKTIEKIKLANYQNATVEEAKTALSNKGLTTTLVYNYSDTIEKDKVISTDPAEGTELIAGDTVTLYVSTGNKFISVEVPTVTGYTEKEAIDMLANKGFSCCIEYKEDNTNVGKVISQSISGGSQAQELTMITITVGKEESTQPETTVGTVTVPALIGTTETSAKSLCESLGLTANITYIENDNYVGKVVSQSIASGNLVEKNTQISLTVGKATETKTTQTTEPETTK